MSRPPRGQKVIDGALQAIASATTIEQLRQAQAVVLPLHYGMNLEQRRPSDYPKVGCVVCVTNSLPGKP